MKERPFPAVCWLRVLVGLCLAGLMSAALALNSSALGEDPVKDRIFASGFEFPEPPGEIERLPPSDSVLPADALPQIGLRLLGDEVGRAGWRLFLDGVDVTDHAQTSAEGIVYTTQEPLFEGEHAIEVRREDDVWRWSFRTATSPEIYDTGPETVAGFLDPDELRPIISASYSDVGSGIDVASVRMLVNGQEVTSHAEVDAAGIRFIPSEDLSDGPHNIRLDVADLAGNRSTLNWGFMAGVRPVVEIVRPSEDVLPFGSRPVVEARLTLSRGEIDTSRLWFRFNGEDVLDQATFTMVSPREGTVVFQPAAPLASGDHSVWVMVNSEAGNYGGIGHAFKVDIERIYRLDLVSPASGSTVLDSEVEIWVLADSTSGLPEHLTIAGGEPEDWDFDDNADAWMFMKRVSLQPGVNTISVRAEFPDGEVRVRSFDLIHEPLPEVVMNRPGFHGGCLV